MVESQAEGKTEVVGDEGKDAKAAQTVRYHTYAALGVGAIPVPYIDIVGLTGIQLNLLKSLADEYDIPFQSNLAKELLGTLLGVGTPYLLNGPVSSFLKVIPFIGSLAGAATMSITGAASTYAIGKVFQQHFASGGTFLTFDPEKVRDHFAEYYAEGKTVAKAAKAKA